jgi:hypothetical protein
MSPKAAFPFSVSLSESVVCDGPCTGYRLALHWTNKMHLHFQKSFLIFLTSVSHCFPGKIGSRLFGVVFHQSNYFNSNKKKMIRQ